MTKKQPKINKFGAKGDSCRFRGGGSPGLAPLTFAASLFNFLSDCFSARPALLEFNSRMRSGGFLTVEKGV